MVYIQHLGGGSSFWLPFCYGPFGYGQGAVFFFFLNLCSTMSVYSRSQQFSESVHAGFAVWSKTVCHSRKVDYTASLWLNSWVNRVEYWTLHPSFYGAFLTGESLSNELCSGSGKDYTWCEDGYPGLSPEPVSPNTVSLYLLCIHFLWLLLYPPSLQLFIHSSQNPLDTCSVYVVSGSPCQPPTLLSQACFSSSEGDWRSARSPLQLLLDLSLHLPCYGTICVPSSSFCYCPYVFLSKM